MSAVSICSSVVRQFNLRLSTIKNRAPECFVVAQKKFLFNDGVCEYCRNRPADSEDHFEPLTYGSRPTGYCHEPVNLVKCCSYCNSSKGNKSILDWLHSTAPGNPLKNTNVSNRTRKKELKKWEEYSDLVAKYCTFLRLDDDDNILFDEVKAMTLAVLLKVDAIADDLRRKKLLDLCISPDELTYSTPNLSVTANGAAESAQSSNCVSANFEGVGVASVTSDLQEDAASEPDIRGGAQSSVATTNASRKSLYDEEQTKVERSRFKTAIASLPAAARAEFEEKWKLQVFWYPGTKRYQVKYMDGDGKSYQSLPKAKAALERRYAGDS